MHSLKTVVQSDELKTLKTKKDFSHVFEMIISIRKAENKKGSRSSPFVYKDLMNIMFFDAMFNIVSVVIIVLLSWFMFVSISMS